MKSAFLPFPFLNIFCFQKQKYQMSDFKLLSANAFNLDKSKVLSFGKELLKMIVLNQIPKRAFVSTCLLYMPFEKHCGKRRNCS